MPRKLVILTTVIIGITIALIVNSGCQSQRIDTVTFGVVLPLTGDIASYGNRSLNGLRLALEQDSTLATNRQVKIELDVQDGQGKAAQSVSIAKQFGSVGQYPVLIGAAASSVSLAIAPVAEQYEMVQITPVSSSPELTTKGGSYFFRVCPSDDYQAIILAEWMLEEGFDSVGILYVNNSWGVSLKEQFQVIFIEGGGTISSEEGSNEGDTDFRTTLAKVISSKPRAIYSPTYGAEGGLILRQLREMGYRGAVFGSDVWSAPELLTAAGEAAEGVNLVKPAAPQGPLFEQFASKYLERYKEEPDVYAAYSFDLMQILIKAVNYGARSGEDVREFLSKMEPFEGVSGITQFDQNGDCNTKSFSKQMIKHGKYIEVE